MKFLYTDNSGFDYYELTSDLGKAISFMYKNSDVFDNSTGYMYSLVNLYNGSILEMFVDTYARAVAAMNVHKTLPMILRCDGFYKGYPTFIGLCTDKVPFQIVVSVNNPAFNDEFARKLKEK